MEYRELKKMYDISNHSDLGMDLNLITAHVLKKSLDDLGLFTEISDKECVDIKKLMNRHVLGEPVQKIIGYSIFSDCYIPYSRHTLTPRMETELIVEKVLEIVGNKQLDILDLCTGSGCIAIALAKKTNCRVTAADISRHSTKQATNNAKLNSVDIKVIRTNMFDKIEELYDIIICNPPYIPSYEYNKLDKSVKKHDPKLALVAKEDGLAYYKILANDAKNYLKDGGKLILEIGYNQGQSVKELLLSEFNKVEVLRDYSNNDRIVIAQMI